ncbi:hypothetical protein KJ591_03145 [Patescibacteria group bacterium]|nr:hypothetical protein [Patescibacteria group bacterium]
MNKEKKPKGKRVGKNSMGKLLLILVVVSAATLLLAVSCFNGKQTDEQMNLTSEQPNKKQVAENQEFTSGIIFIEVTPVATPEVTPISKDKPIMLSLKAPKNVSRGETFKVDVVIEPNGNNISIAQFDLKLEGGIQADSFEFSNVPNLEDSGFEFRDGNISLTLVPKEDTFPASQFIAGTLKFSAVSLEEAKISFHKIDIIDPQLNNIYTLGEPTTILIG